MANRGWVAVALAGLTACAPGRVAGPSLPDTSPFLGRYHWGSDFIANSIEVRADGRYFEWSQGCTYSSQDRGGWRLTSDGCILLEPDPPEPCTPSSEAFCCRYPALCERDDAPADRPSTRICRSAGAFALTGKGMGDLAVEWVRGQPSNGSGAGHDDVYAYKVDGACVRRGSEVDCVCAGNRDLAALAGSRPAAELDLAAIEPLDLRLLASHRPERLLVIDPSLTSLAELPANGALVELTVVAPLRTVGDLRRFPRLARLSLGDTHLTDLGELARLPLEKLTVTTNHPLDLAAVRALERLDSLMVGAMGIRSVAAVNDLPNLAELGLFSAHRWPKSTPSLDLDGLASATLRTLALEAEEPRQLAALIRPDVARALPKLAHLEVSGAGHIFNGKTDGPGLVEPNDYQPPPGVALEPLSSDRRPPSWPGICAFLASPALNRCGWSRACSEHGLCSARADGRCQANDDADCRQSMDCIDGGMCRARAGGCVAP